ncbi:gliding motility-associated C-terminal domain-containing protein [Maribacter aquivivus]|uniref:Gliding motility-associated C-terminal domain-containing protein n=1 Tax=Maribacter aquivivus TaxID=228958 RepID=A0A1M6MJ62_9FLAO|nr:T9SS type B sorting domain-containing protein [Maribacter aquivivus]SHJ83512.1 gliding motility-associated C-terminal domain-containing protein [Maribacter aquivivus]
MIKYGISILLICFFSIFTSFAQVSADCANAVPICYNTPVNGGANGYGIDDFNGASISGCINQGSGTIETNSAWYKFKIGEVGQLGFNIGFDTDEDWDFALYRTNDCSTLGDPVRCNYFDNSDDSSFIGVGEDPTGIDNIQYDDWLDVEPGEEYLLMINNFRNNNSGFSIQFSGSIFVEFPYSALDCDIIDNLLGAPVIACDDQTVVLDATTADAKTYQWELDAGAGYQRIPGESDPELSIAVSGMYRVIIVRNSGNPITSETQVAYAPSPETFSLEDETACLDGTAIDFNEKDVEALGAQSPLDFRISYHESFEDAFDGANALSKEFIPTKVAQTIYVRTTSIENSMCFDASETFEVNGIELPVLDFETEVFICGDEPIVTIGQRIPDNDFTYEWSSGQTSSLITVAEPGVYTLSVTNKEGLIQCITVRSVTVVFSSPPVISDITIEYEDDASNVVNVYLEEDGDFEFQVDNETPQNSGVFNNLFPGEHTITVSDVNGCGSDSRDIVVVGFPKFFTPNGDNVNDTWKVDGLSALDNPVITIYDRYGKLLYQIFENSAGWTGSFNGALLPESDYWFKLTYTNSLGESTNASYINNHFTLKR